VQEYCDKIPVRVAGRPLSFFKKKGSEKEIFLKTLSKRLFGQFCDRYSAANTIFVDDSPEKHVLNHPVNVVLLDSWSPKMGGEFDSALVDTLLPWIKSLAGSQSLGLSSFRALNILGKLMMCDDTYNLEYKVIMDAIVKSGARLR
jgi:hypothetical protein